MSGLSPETVSRTIGRIYDCAVDPTMWEPMMCDLRDQMNLAYVQIFLMPDGLNLASAVNLGTPWDTTALDAFRPIARDAPGLQALLSRPIDQPTSQYDVVSEAEFQTTDFYRHWVQPQSLRDNPYTALLARPKMQAGIVATTYATRDLITQAERDAIRFYAPHIRRALLISEMLDEGRLQLQLYRAVLDTLTVGVFMVDEDARIVLSNGTGDAMLGTTGPLGEVSGRLWPHSALHRPALHDAILRASRDNGDGLGTWGNGIALPASDGAISIAYVLPLGRSERRRALGPGHAAVFVTDRSGARPPAAEVLTAMTGLTMAEARVALAVAEGRTTADIAHEMDISVHTLRKHLANIYEKTGLATQSALGAFINRFRLPLA